MLDGYWLKELEMLNKMHNLIQIPRDADDDFLLRATVDLIDQLVYENRELKRKLKELERRVEIGE